MTTNNSLKSRFILFLLLPLHLLTAQSEKFNGYFNFEWDPATGKIMLEVDKLDQEFLYVNALSAGVGSNDIGLDRGQLGNDRIVKFTRSGNKILLIQPNYRYRAISDNELEKASVKEAFAESVLWGFKIESEENGKIKIDLTPMLLSDAHDVTGKLKDSRQGTYKLDATRSAMYMPRTKAFPENTEFDATITFTGEPQGGYIRSVTPTPEAVTVRMHHSFIKLPDNNYTPRAFHPFSGFNQVSFYDYASPIYEDMEIKYIARHRLEKKDPAAAISEAVEPIVYYLDPGTPEPVRSALLDGGKWWNQAFEAAGYKDAFQVKMLPEGADMLDVRYNVIQWVHRSTRGWSYGASVADPRTGEIIKGHVSLGSLRVRQDFLIAQGLLSPYGESDENHDPMMELALARLRQLSAHEIGHTIGLSHNFASSYNGRASVMDYPHPVLKLNDDGTLDLSEAYEVGIGDWDKRTIIYGYQDFPEEVDEEKALKEIISESINDGYLFISDRDARAPGGAHPYGHLWDNGASPIDEMKRLSALRTSAMSRFGEASITNGTPYSRLENVLVPLYLAHRYQAEAVSKLIGGIDYTFALKGDEHKVINEIVSADLQKEAMEAMLETLNPEFLEIPEAIIKLIPPAAFGYNRDRETFERYTSLNFDPIAAAEGSANHTLSFMLHKERLARLVQHNARDNSQFSLKEYLSAISDYVFSKEGNNSMQGLIAQSNQRLYVTHLIGLMRDDSVYGQVGAEVNRELDRIKLKYLISLSPNARYLMRMIDNGMDTSKTFKMPEMPEMPPGAPIGCF